MYISKLIRGTFLGLIVLGLTACAGSADETATVPTSVTTPDTTVGEAAASDTTVSDTTVSDTTTADTTAPVTTVSDTTTTNAPVTIAPNALDESVADEEPVADTAAPSDTLTQDTPTSSQDDPAPLDTTPEEPVADTTAPSTPSNLRTATGSPTSSSVQLLWNASTDNVAVSGYRVMRGNTVVATTTTTTYTDSNVSPESAYQYTIVAFDAADNTASSDTVLVSTLADVTTGVATLHWTAPTLNTDDSSLTDLSGYKIYYGLSSASLTNSITINNIGVASYVIENLDANTTYYFSITAINDQDSESAYSNIVSKYISS